MHGRAGWVRPAAGANAPLYADQNPLAATSFETKITLLKEIDAYARAADSRVKQVSASVAGSWQAVQILRADGIRVDTHLAVGNPRGCLGAPGTPLPKILKILARYGGAPRGSLTPPYRVTHTN